MFKNIKKGMFPFLIAFSALSVSASAAFYSVYGLSKLFAGAQFQVIIMAGSLEFAKLVTASLLYQYWDTINKTLRTYLSIATVILVLITSMGIYGFLSAAYQDTYSKLSIAENEIKFLQNKRDFYEEDVERFDEELKKISENISVLSSAKASSIQVRDTSSTTGFRQTISTTELRLAAKRIEVEEENRKNTYAKREIVADSLQKYQLNILELQSNNEIAAELGPLQYLSGLTGIPMDKIINVLLLIIIFVFDPLAISLVVAANFAFDKAYPRKKYRENLYEEKVEIKEKEEFDWDKAEKRMNVIGQNGNDGEHYSKEQPDASKMSDRLKRKRSILREMLEDKGGWNGNIERVEERIDEALKEIDDTTKTY
jgi:peptidoglycan hydrolase CwlO-like protein